MKRWLMVAAIATMALVVSAPAWAQGGDPAGPGPGGKAQRFVCQGTVVSVDADAGTLVVKVKMMSRTFRGAKALRGEEVTVAVTDQTVVLLRQKRANRTLSGAVPMAFADLKPGRAVNIAGTVVVQDGVKHLTARRIVMLVPTYKFQSNATIVSTDEATGTFVVKVKTMSRAWHGWRQMRSLRGDEITIVTTEATRFYKRQLGEDGSVGPVVEATFAELVAGNRVHIGGRVVAAEDGSIEFRALRVVEFLPAPVAP